MAYYPMGTAPPPPPMGTAPPPPQYQPMPPHFPAGGVPIPGPGYPPCGVPGFAPPVVPSYGPVLNPTIPYVGPLSRLSDGSIIRIEGIIPKHCQRFHINLSTGPRTNEKVDSALHLNPRFEGVNEIVRNSYTQGYWGNEEKKGGHFPLAKGQHFQCIILTTNNEYRIAFNGAHYCEFTHRLPKELVSHLVIEGDVNIDAITEQSPVLNPPPPPPPHPAQPPFGFVPPMMIPECAPPPPRPPGPPVQPPIIPKAYKLPLPYMCAIPGSMSRGKMIIISGTVNGPNPDRFHIDLGNGDGSTIAFHISVRFKDGFIFKGEAVVRNSMIRNSWGREEREMPSFPFKAGQHFDMIILCEHFGYKVAVNGKHFIDFKHRQANMRMINSVKIYGDLSLEDLKIQGGTHGGHIHV